MELGPVFWNCLWLEGKLPAILRARVEESGSGDSISKWMNRHQPELMEALEKMKTPKPVKGNIHKQTNILILLF